MSSSTTSITAAVAGFADIPSRAIGVTARDVARLSLLDWLAVALAGLDEPVAAHLRALAAEEAGTPQATLFGHAAKVPARMAALGNGALSHALDYDDTHFAYVGHPSVAVFPAALAMAERTDASAAAFLDAALIGMEAACRVGAWLGTRHYNHGFHQTATSGAFGATVAAGRLAGLSGPQMQHALGLAATRASGLKSQFGTMGKPFNAGIAAANGVEAALLGGRDFVSRPDGLECLQGFADTHQGEAGDPAAALAGIGQTWLFENVQHKFHACCHGLHAMLEALALLRGEGLAAEAVERVTISTNPRWLKVCNIAAPRTGLEAKFSYRLTAAMALAGKSTAALDSYTEQTCADPVLVRLAERVTVAADAAVGDTATRVVVETRDGRRLAADFDLDRPLPLAVRREKIIAKLGALVPAAASDLVRLDSALGTLSARELAARVGLHAVRRQSC